MDLTVHHDPLALINAFASCAVHVGVLPSVGTEENVILQYIKHTNFLIDSSTTFLKPEFKFG